METNIDRWIEPHSCTPRWTFPLSSQGRQKSVLTRWNWGFEANAAPQIEHILWACVPPAGWGCAGVRVSKLETLSDGFTPSRGNVVPCGARPLSQDLKWAGWKNNVRTRFGTQQVGTTSKASVWSPSLQAWTSQKYTPQKLRLSRQRRVAVVKQTRKYAKPVAENNADMTDRLSLLQ